MRNQKGLSFVELSVVILLIFVLVIGFVYLFGGKVAETRDAKRVKNFQEIEKILVDEFAINGSYPSDDEFEDLVGKELLDPANGEKSCIDSDGEMRECEFLYHMGNRGFDYMLIGFFETEEKAQKLYEDVQWDREWIRGYVQATRTNF